ncbi:MAG: GMC family oxidoreductase [Acidobacteriota bacterium]|nr:GMC family oxidoreductase [Acidobacteriota bacterium]
MNNSFDVVIVGGGVSSAMIAKQLGAAGRKVLIIEAGDAIPPNINDFMERFYTSAAKVPEAPYTPDVIDSQGAIADPTLLNAGRPTVLTLQAGNWQDSHQAYLIQHGPLAFGSTYERIAGGTMRHWLGTSLRMCPNDFRTQSQYGQMQDWPIDYDDMIPWYGRAEAEIGVSANKEDQAYLGITFPADYDYPMPKIPPSLVDGVVTQSVTGMVVDDIPLAVASTPAGRNSRPYQNRPVCQGNTNCIPICPIGAKYDPSVTLNAALNTGNVTLWTKTVANNVVVDENGRVTEIQYLQYEDIQGPSTGSGSVTAKVFVIAAHAIEGPKLLLMSTNGGRTPNGVANRSGQLGRNLMDHPLYLAWALLPEPAWGYRGPLATSGIESLRDGPFRSERAAFRIEIGNEGWNFSIGDPSTTTLDFINGMNASGLNPVGGGTPQALFGPALTTAINTNLTRQFRLGFLMEQSPEQNNRVTVSKTLTDHLGIPRPEIAYDLSDYTRKGFAAAKKCADAIFAKMGARQFTTVPADDDPATVLVDIDGEETRLKYFGAGHVVGTYRMGTDPTQSVVDRFQRCWDHPNLFLVGSGVFPTVATGNPTLTITALALWAAQTIAKDLE